MRAATIGTVFVSTVDGGESGRGLDSIAKTIGIDKESPPTPNNAIDSLLIDHKPHHL